MLLKLDNISFAYSKNKKNIFNGLTLELFENESVTIMASSGSGKTTLFKILTQFLVPNSGNVSYFKNTTLQDFSYIKQTAMDMLFPWKTVKNNIEFPLKERKKLNQKSKKHLQNLIGKLQIQHLLQSYPKDLSGGEQKRVSIACGLSYAPKLILLDEAFTGIDMQLKLKLWRFFKEEIAAKKEISSLMITHDIDEALFLSDRILFLSNNGAIENRELIIPKHCRFTKIDDYFSQPEIVNLKKEILSILEKNALSI